MKYSIYRKSDGVIISHMESDEAHICQNVPTKCSYLIGHHDYRTLRIDVEHLEEKIDADVARARDEHIANTEAKWKAHQEAMFVARDEHNLKQAELVRKNRVERSAAMRENRPLPKSIEPAPFIEHWFIEPKFDEIEAVRQAMLTTLIDYRPPAPSMDHEWNHETKRWQLSLNAHACKQAIAEMERLELKLIRPLRELSIDPLNQDALAKRDEVEARCNQLRAVIRSAGSAK
jgi:hypothetical protein